MAATHAVIDKTTTIGKQAARAAELFLEARALINTVHGAANQATDAGTDTTKLTGAPFGGLTNADSAKYWTAINTIKTLLDGDDAGGIMAAANSLYNGESE